jgi:predicted ferric reductase
MVTRLVQVEVPREDGAIEISLPISTEEDDLWDFHSVNSEDGDDESFDSAWGQEEEDSPCTRSQGYLESSSPEIQQQGQEANQDGHLVRWRRSALTCWRNQRVACAWLSLYAAANVGAFYYKASVYVNDPKHEVPREVFGHCVVVARGAAMCLNLNACLILLPLCRHFWTFVQRSPALRCCSLFPEQYYRYYHRKKPRRLHWSSWLPLDQWVLIHKVVGAVFLYWTLLHCAAHACDFHRFANHPFEEDLLVLFPDVDTMPSDPAGRWKFILQQPAAITGMVMVCCIILAYPLILYRHKFGYNVFWYSHHLLLVMLVTLLFHGMGHLLEPPKSYLWVGVPCILYMIPRIWREVACLFCPQVRAQVLELSIKPGNLVCLKMTKPSCWEGCLLAGMYANLNIPYISSVQWHPFTMSSAPSDDYIEFHIRPVGDWTSELFKLAKRLATPSDSSSCELEIGKSKTLPKAVEQQPWSAMERHASDLSSTATDSETRPNMIGRCEEHPLHNDHESPPPQRHPPPQALPSRRRSSQWLWDASSSRMNLSISPTNRSGGTASSSLGTVPEQPQEKLSLQDLIVKVDGPLGAPAQGYSLHRMVVLVGAGIGITPMISVLKELLANPGKMQRTYLIWTFRDHRAMQWFSSLVQDVLNKNNSFGVSQRNLQLRFFVTSKKKEDMDFQSSAVTDSASMAIQYGQRPNFDQELFRIHQDIRALDYYKCGIFVCGPVAMAKTIRRSGARISKQDPKFHFYCREEKFSS